MKTSGMFVVAILPLLLLGFTRPVFADNNLVITSTDSSSDGRCCYTIVGEVYNAGSDEAFNVRVTAYLLDAQGYIIWDTKMVEDPLLSVGASSFFRIFVVFSGVVVLSTIASYRVYVSSD